MKRTFFLILPILMLGMGMNDMAWARGWGGGGYRGGGYYGGGHYGGGGYRGGGYYGGGYRGGVYYGGGRYGGGYYNRGHYGGGVGIYLGSPWYWPGYYGYGPQTYYYPYYSPPIVVPATPPVYIEQGGTPQPSADADWNYCENPQGYYPYVQDCPSGWQSVPRQPPGQDADHWYFCAAPQGYYPYIRECPGGWQPVQPTPTPEN